MFLDAIIGHKVSSDVLRRFHYALEMTPNMANAAMTSKMITRSIGGNV